MGAPFDGHQRQLLEATEGRIVEHHRGTNAVCRASRREKSHRSVTDTMGQARGTRGPVVRRDPFDGTFTGLLLSIGYSKATRSGWYDSRKVQQ